MRKITLLILAVVTGFLPERAFAGESLLLKNIRIVSPERTEASEPIDVLIIDGRIARIEADITADVDTLDGTGRFLSPGLIDSHTHLRGVPGMRHDQQQANPNAVADALAQHQRSYLYYGFTSVVDLHNTPDHIKAWNAHTLRPQAYFCGGAPILDGYPMLFMPKPLRYKIHNYFLYDERYVDQIEGDFPEGFDKASHTANSVVARMKADGAVCLKTHYESGFGGSGDLPVPPLGLTLELVAQAHTAGLKVVLHANSEEAQRFGVKAGVDAFVHGMWNWDRNHETTLYDGVTRLVDTAAAAGIALQPTVQVLFGRRDLQDPKYLARAELQDAVPASMLNWYASYDGQWYRRKMANIPYVKEALAAHGWQAVDGDAIKRVMASFSRWVEQGGALLFGSDTPSDTTFANQHGLNGALERRHWKKAGVTPSAFLRAATLSNAEFFGLEAELGTIEVGKRADLLLLQENPLIDIDAFDAIEGVILAGRYLERKMLSARHLR